MSNIVSYRCALVTGASAGLGEEFARQLAPRCHHLVLVARRGDRLAELAEELEAEHEHLAVHVATTDLLDEGGRQALVNWLDEERLCPDLLVNNAGMGDYGEFATAAWDKLEAMLRLNIEALTHLTHAVLPGMLQMGHGAVINVSSLASVLPIPDFAVYAATKAYVTSFSEALRIELRPHGIPVVALCPGPVHTEFGTIARRNSDRGDMPGREWFYVPKERVVAEALAGLHHGCARVYPGWQVALAAAVITSLPIVAIRWAMGFRPRR